MHNEDLEEISTVLASIEKSCSNQRQSSGTMVMESLKPILEDTFGQVPKVMTTRQRWPHCRSVLNTSRFCIHYSRKCPDGVIYLEDMWPNVESEEISLLIEDQQSEENQRTTTDTGSVHHAKLRAEKARLAEEESTRKREKALAKMAKESVNVEIKESDELEEQSYDGHEWLVE